MPGPIAEPWSIIVSELKIRAEQAFTLRPLEAQPRVEPCLCLPLDTLLPLKVSQTQGSNPRRRHQKGLGVANGGGGGGGGREPVGRASAGGHRGLRAVRGWV